MGGEKKNLSKYTTNSFYIWCFHIKTSSKTLKQHILHQIITQN